MSGPAPSGGSNGGAPAGTGSRAATRGPSGGAPAAGTSGPGGGSRPRPRDASARARPGWDLGHLRAGLTGTAILLAGGVPLAWAVRDGRAAAWVAVGLGIVATFFSVSALVVAAAGRLGDAFTLPAALATYVIKIVLLGVLLVSVRGRPWLDAPALGVSVLVGTLAWTALHIRRVWTSDIYYVDP
jgi:hypothetical protein